MLTCENCGTSFEQPERLEEVTSLRVLCPRCTAARAAAKASKVPIDGVRSGAEARASRTAAPIPAKKLQARTDARAAPSEARPVRPDARPAQPEQRTARAAEAPSRPRPAEAESRPANAKPANASSSPAAGAPKTRAERAPRKPTLDVEALASRNLQKRGSREVWVAFGVAILVFGVAGGFGWKVLGKKAADKAAREAALARIEAFKNEFRGMDISTEEGARRLIAYGDENKGVYAGLDELEAEVISRTAKANTLLETLQERGELNQRLAGIEEILARASELTPSELAEQRRRLEELKPKAGIVGPEFEARLDKDRADAERVHMERLLATAEAAAATDPLDRAALATLAQTEDEVFKMLDGVAKLWDKNKGDTALVDKKKEYEEKYKGVMKLADEAVERFYTPEAIEAVPWRDLLADPKAWKGTALKGFEHPIVDGVLHLVGPDPSEGGQGVMSIGDKEIWRDFIVELEITIEQGSAEFFFRLPINWQKNVETLGLTTDEGGLEPGRTYTYIFSIIGSTITQEEVSEDSSGPTRSNVSWIQIRKGAFAVAVPKDTRIKISKLRAKVLR